MGGTQSTGAPASSPEYSRGFEAGREESTKEIQSAFSAVAAQVYDGVHGHLEQLQTKQLDNSKALAAELKDKLTPLTTVLVSDKSLCGSESELLTTCLKANTSSPLVCSGLVEAYSKCASGASAKGKR